MEVETAILVNCNPANTHYRFPSIRKSKHSLITIPVLIVITEFRFVDTCFDINVVWNLCYITRGLGFSVRINHNLMNFANSRLYLVKSL